MGENRLIPVADLLIDEHNPRLSSVDAGQRLSLRNLAEHQTSKLLVLARSIAQNGINPVELPIVIPDAKQRNRYRVLEGNRRLCALQILNDPSILGTSIGPGIRQSFLAASKAYHEHGAVDEVLCFVVSDRAEARYWMLLRHTGENKGAGVASWGPVEQSRFEGHPEPYLDILTKLIDEGIIPADTTTGRFTTTFKRIVETAAVRDLLGYEIVEKRVHYTGAWPETAKLLVRIVDDLRTKRKNVDDVRTKEQRIEYVRSLLPGGRPVKGKTPKQLQPSAPVRAKPTTTGKATIAAAPGLRKALIPQFSGLRVTVPRIASIEYELQSLPLDGFPNAVAIVFRVFLELSVEHYVSTAKLTVHPGAKLRDKVGAAIKSLKTAGALNANQERAALHATQKGTLLATSVTTMNHFVHNPHFTPSAVELRGAWDRLEPLFQAIWPK